MFSCYNPLNMHSRSGAVARLIVIDLLGSVAWFPVWWYSKGLLKVLNRARAALKYRVASYGFAIWVKNFFVPMYGQYDLTGRLVSVLMRFVVLVGRSIALVVEALVYGLGIALWVVTPVALVLLLLGNITGSFLNRV